MAKVTLDREDVPDFDVQDESYEEGSQDRDFDAQHPEYEDSFPDAAGDNVSQERGAKKK